MRKMYFKLIAVTLALILSVSVVAVSSYAWFVLAGNPAVTGIQVTIGGGNTLLIAPDVTEEKDGVTYHYPGAFSDKINFSQQKSYTYLQEIGGLTPVSTVDGVNWFLPDYYTYTDVEVQEGKALAGQLKSVEAFIQDGDLEHANLPADAEDTILEGHYAYLDFWVVSPNAEYTLRLSTGDDSGGSFLVELPQAIAVEDGTGYVLTYPDSMAATAARVGFLTNPHRLTDDSMLLYQNSPFFNSQFTSLQGILQEPDSGTADFPGNRFTIFEPNADRHFNPVAANGTYVETKPVGLAEGVPTLISIADRVTVQKASSWKSAETGVGTAIEQQFQTGIVGKDLTGMEPSQIVDAFFESYLQWQISPYLQKGAFIKRTADLYAYGSEATAEQLSTVESAGATDDVYIIKLERNVPQRIRMFIWLEGQDVDCMNSSVSSSFTVSIELAGATE